MKSLARAAVVLVLSTLASPLGAQVASLLPNGLQQFTDNNGVPLSTGAVCFYQPGTTTPKTTWADPNETTANTSPCVTLDSAGRATIYGAGQYTETVLDSLGNTIWSGLTYGILPTLPSVSGNQLLCNPTGSTANVIGCGLGPGLSFSSGVLSEIPGVSRDSTSTTVTAAFANSIHITTAALTYTLPLSSTLGAGFSMTVIDTSGTTTLTPNAADNFVGSSTGASITMTANAALVLTTDGLGHWYALRSASCCN